MNESRRIGETGVDIVAKKGVHTFHIDVISYKKKGPARSKDFFSSFFRAISRLNDNTLIVLWHCQWGLKKDCLKE